MSEVDRLKRREAELGIDGSASWHEEFRSSAYICVRGLPYVLNEGDIIVVFSQFGEVVDCNLMRDKDTGKSRGFAFIAYEDQRSTILAVENMDDVLLKGRRLRVGHVKQYRKPYEEGDDHELEDEDEYTARRRKIWDYEAYEALDVVQASKEEKVSLASEEEKRLQATKRRIEMIKEKRKAKIFQSESRD